MDMFERLSAAREALGSFRVEFFKDYHAVLEASRTREVQKQPQLKNVPGQDPPTPSILEYWQEQAAMPDTKKEHTPNPTAHFTWPEEGSPQEVRLIQKLHEVEAGAEFSPQLELYAEILHVFQNQTTLDVVSDICMTAEAYYGIVAIEDVQYTAPESRAPMEMSQLGDCYVAVEAICSDIEDILGFTNVYTTESGNRVTVDPRQAEFFKNIFLS